MTRFFEIPGKDNVAMETQMPDDAWDTIVSIRSIENTDTTEVINRIIGVHAMHDEAAALGMIIVSRNSDRIATLQPSVIAGDNESCDEIRVSIVPRARNHLLQFADEDNPFDLVPFWRSAARHYNDWSKRQMMGEDMLLLDRNLRAERLYLQGNLFEPHKPLPKWRQLFNRLLL